MLHRRDLSMSDWTGGYVTDTQYTFGYYPELNPARVAWALLSRGLRPPRVSTACELGFGLGVSTCIHAVSNKHVNWWGNDFNPGQVYFARELAGLSKRPIALFEDSFEEFADRKDLPPFDFIGAHGVLSWISEENVGHILRIIRGSLKPGGVAYFGYNVLPGWANFLAIRRLLLAEVKSVLPEHAPTRDKVRHARSVLEQLVETNPIPFTLVPSLNQDIRTVLSRPDAYLAHEFFNADWHPFHVDQVFSLLRSAKLEFAASLNPVEPFSSLNLSASGLRFMEARSGTGNQQGWRDFLVNESFRRDLFVKGGSPLNVGERDSLVDALWVQPRLTPRDDDFRLKGARTSGTLDVGAFGTARDILEKHGSQTVRAFSDRLNARGISLDRNEVLMGLEAKGWAWVVDSAPEEAIDHDARLCLNAWGVSDSEFNHRLGYLIHPSGEPMEVNQVECRWLNYCHTELGIDEISMKIADDFRRAGIQLLDDQGGSIGPLQAKDRVTALIDKLLQSGERKARLQECLL